MKTCGVYQKIDTENYALGSPLNTTVEKFYINENKEVKFLPIQVGEKFPKLLDFQATSCALTVIRNSYFKNMQNLIHLNLADNEITTIEAEAFKDLVNVTGVWLNYNKIESFDEKHFIAMVKLDELFLNRNKIKSLSPNSFTIPGGQLKRIHLESNVCINGVYTSSTIRQLQNDLKANCEA